MSRNLAEFIETFVTPLLGGGPVVVGAPIRPRDHELMLEDAGHLGQAQLRELRLRRAALLMADPPLPDPDALELSLWVGLHNVLVFDHPDRARVWSRALVWRRVEGSTRTALTLPGPTDVGEGLARHLSVGAFIELVRTDVVLTTAAGELRFLGQPLPRRRLRLSNLPQQRHREETVPWLAQSHAAETQRLVEDALRASPLTCILRPRLAPPGWSPLWGSEFFQDRALVRAICHCWARRRDWVAVGGAVTGALLPSFAPLTRAPEQPLPRTGEPLALPGAVVPTSPRALGGVVAALVHLHFLKVLELDARLGVAAGSRDPAVMTFLALPLLQPWLSPVLGSPMVDPQMVDPPLFHPQLDAASGSGDSAFGAGGQPSRLEVQIARLWGEYLDHLEELVPRAVVDNLLASLVPRIVQTS